MRKTVEFLVCDDDTRQTIRRATKLEDLPETDRRVAAVLVAACLDDAAIIASDWCGYPVDITGAGFAIAEKQSADSFRVRFYIDRNNVETK